MDSEAQMASAVEKICVVCGRDVRAEKRTKDAAGHYYCQSCYQAVTARQIPATETQPAEPAAVPTTADTSASALADLATAVGSHSAPRAERRGRLPLAIAALSVVAVAIAGGMFIARSRAGSGSGSAGQPSSTMACDLHDHPETIGRSDVTPVRLAVQGVCIGDEKSSVLKIKSGLTESEMGSIVTEPGFVYSIQNGHVAAIYLSDKEWIRRAGLTTCNDALKIFGAPDAKQHTTVYDSEVKMCRERGMPPPPDDGLVDFLYQTKGVELKSVDGTVNTVILMESPGVEALRFYAKSAAPLDSALLTLRTDLVAGVNLDDFRGLVQRVTEAKGHVGFPPSAWLRPPASITMSNRQWIRTRVRCVAGAEASLTRGRCTWIRRPVTRVRPSRTIKRWVTITLN